jgi:hypothetical protein
LQAKLTLTRDLPGDGNGREVLRLYKTGLAAAEGQLYKPVYLVSLTRETPRTAFDLYAIPLRRLASPDEEAAFRAELARLPDVRILAERGQGGLTQDLLTARP